MQQFTTTPVASGNEGNDVITMRPACWNMHCPYSKDVSSCESTAAHPDPPIHHADCAHTWRHAEENTKLASTHTELLKHHLSPPLKPPLRPARTGHPDTHLNHRRRDPSASHRHRQDQKIQPGTHDMCTKTQATWTCHDQLNVQLHMERNVTWKMLVKLSNLTSLAAMSGYL